MKLVYAKNPVWANRNKTMINLTVRFEEINEDLPFTAMLNDTAQHCHDIFISAKAGKFGTVQEFKAVSPTSDEVANAIRTVRNNKLKTEVDPLVSNPLRWIDLTTEQQQEIADYRRSLLNMTDDPQFPWFNKVVVETDFGFSVETIKAPWPTKPSIID